MNKKFYLLAAIVILSAIWVYFFFFNKPSPIKQINVEDIENMLIVNAEGRTTKQLSAQDTDAISNVLTTLKGVSFKNSSSVPSQEKIGSVNININVSNDQSSIKLDIYPQQISINETMYDAVLDFNKFYDSIAIAAAPFER